MIIIINKDVYYILISLLLTTARRGNPSLTTRWENRKTIMGRDKKVACGKCLRVMRRDTLKRHMKQHEKEKFEKEVFSSASIRSSTTSLQEDCKSVSDFSSVPAYTSTPINKEFIIKTMVMNADKYKQDMEVGKIVAKSITNG